jgi:hypothetical protein
VPEPEFAWVCEADPVAPVRPYRIAALADLGVAVGFNVTLPRLQQQAEQGDFDDIIIAGDIAYDLWNQNGELMNIFMRGLDGIARRGVAIQYAAGNHESRENFAHYTARMEGQRLGAGQRGRSNSARYYSWDQGLVHFIAVDTEFDFYGGTAEEIQAQRDWLRADLAAVDRRVRPWVIAYGHKQVWMDSQFFDPLEKILNDGGVDIYVTGHSHGYQRTLPLRRTKVEAGCMAANRTLYVDCTAMTTLVVGSAGNKEGISYGTAGATRITTFIGEFGYGVFNVWNQSHIHWVWTATANASRVVYTDPANATRDEAWFIKSAPAPVLLLEKDYFNQLPSITPSVTPSTSASASVSPSSTASPSASATNPSPTRTSYRTYSPTRSVAPTRVSLSPTLSVVPASLRSSGNKVATNDIIAFAMGGAVALIVLLLVVCIAIWYCQSRRAKKSIRRSTRLDATTALEKPVLVSDNPLNASAGPFSGDPPGEPPSLFMDKSSEKASPAKPRKATRLHASLEKSPQSPLLISKEKRSKVFGGSAGIMSGTNPAHASDDADPQADLRMMKFAKSNVRAAMSPTPKD